MKTILVWAALLLGAMAPAWAQPVDGGPLTVCMQQNDPPLSLRAGTEPTGFDLALSRKIAARLGRDLKVQWFVSRDDPDSNLVKDANALLSDGRCELIAEFPLTEATLEPPRSPSAKLPPFDGAKPDDRRRWVKVGTLAATRPYRSDALTVILSAKEAERRVRTLADLDGLKVGVLTSSLADAIAMQYGDGRLSQYVVHLADSRALFSKLASGDLGAAFVDLRAFDAWREKHGNDGLASTGYRHSLGFNMGFAGLATNQQLIGQVDAMLGDLQGHDAIAPLAATAGLTFIPPAAPPVAPKFRLTALNGD